MQSGRIRIVGSGIRPSLVLYVKTTESVHWAITGACLRMRHRPSAHRLYRFGIFTVENVVLLQHSWVYLVRLKPILRTLSFFSALTLLVTSKQTFIDLWQTKAELNNHTHIESLIHTHAHIHIGLVLSFDP